MQENRQKFPSGPTPQQEPVIRMGSQHSATCKCKTHVHVTADSERESLHMKKIRDILFVSVNTNPRTFLGSEF